MISMFKHLSFWNAIRYTLIRKLAGKSVICINTTVEYYGSIEAKDYPHGAYFYGCIVRPGSNPFIIGRGIMAIVELEGKSFAEVSNYDL